jgi:hypothetical protein
MGARNKGDFTLDIRPMYTEAEMLDADTGEMVKGLRLIPSSCGGMLIQMNVV